jgi:hypothetical protein
MRLPLCFSAVVLVSAIGIADGADPRSSRRVVVSSSAIRVLDPARAQRLVRQVVHVLQNEQFRHQPSRQAGLTRTRHANAGKAADREIPNRFLRLAAPADGPDR